MSLKRMCAGAAAALATTFITPVAAQAFQPPTPQSFIHNCAPKQVVVVPGGANTNPFMPDKLPIGLITGDVGTQLGNRADTDVTYIPYQSYSFAAAPYPQASADGYTKASHTIARIQNDCPHSKISLVGYSLGADISARIINDAAHGKGALDPSRFASAALYANPYQGGNGAAQYPAKPDVNTGSLGQLGGGFGNLGAKVLEVCHSDDAVCNYPKKYRKLAEASMNIDMLHGKFPPAVARELAHYNPHDYRTLIHGFKQHNAYGGPDNATGVNWINTH